MSSDRYDYIVNAFIDMETALEEAGIDVSSEAMATLVAADLLHSLYNSIEYRGI
jgi:hypothetical protein